MLLGLAEAGPPTVHHQASQACIDHRYPRVVDGQLIACDKMRRTVLEVNLVGGKISERSTPHQPPTLDHLKPAQRAGTLPAQATTGLAWVTNGPQDDADVWWAPSDGSPPRPLDVGPGDQHHPVAFGEWLAWVSFSDLKLWNTLTGERRKINAGTGFNAPPALGDGVACWETRGATSVDIECSNGRTLVRDGHQTHPQILGERLLFRERGVLLSVDLRAKP